MVKLDNSLVIGVHRNTILGTKSLHKYINNLTRSDLSTIYFYCAPFFQSIPKTSTNNISESHNVKLKCIRGFKNKDLGLDIVRQY